MVAVGWLQWGTAERVIALVLQPHFAVDGGAGR
jgi:hypothetical protein